MDVTRPLGTYSHFYWLMYLLAAAVLVAFALGVWLRIRRWRRGVGTLQERLHFWPRRGIDLIVDLVSHRRFRRATHPWLFHALLVWGFAIFFVGTLCVMLQENFSLPTFSGQWYLALSLALDLFAVLVLGAVFAAGWRRWIRKPEELSDVPSDSFVLVLIAAVVVTGLLLEGVRIAQEPRPWSLWSPMGYGVALLLAGTDLQTLLSVHRGLWWGHLLLSLGLIAAIPFTRLFHLLVSPAALFLKDETAAKALVPLDFSDEEAESFGVGSIEDFHWKRLLDADACTGCGRCQVQCPAWQAGKSLSPKAAGENLSALLAGHSLNGHKNETPVSFAGEVVGEEALWSCTTCRACELYCPVGIEHVPRFVDMRRFLVLTEARFPVELQTAFRGMERQGNPWGFDYKEQALKDGFPALADEPQAEILLWPGCTGIYDPRCRQVTIAFSALLKLAGVRFAVLGAESCCCGDAARRLGNEYLFQDLALRNIAALDKSGLQRIVTTCPHCLNTLNNEYPQFGGRFRAVHHTTYLRELLNDKRLEMAPPELSEAVFHDPCYLARYAGEVAAPRFLLDTVTRNPVELEKHGEDGFCCGGGGGRMWLEEKAEKSVADVRVDQILNTAVSTVATACPFCLTMLSDGMKRRDSEVRIADLAELLAENLIPLEKGGGDGKQGPSIDHGFYYDSDCKEERTQGNRRRG